MIISALVLVITAGWLAYTGNTGGISHARPGANLLPALYPADTGSLASTGDPVQHDTTGGWTANHSGDADVTLHQVAGQLTGGQALKLDIARYASGDVTITSPRVQVESGKDYLFKAFATSDSNFRLLVRKYHPDGSSTLEQLHNPLERPGTSPFTVSDAFNSADSTTAVEYVFRFAAAGT
ncbi:MAG: hypothetical protein ACLGH7_06470, partial [Actinomycetes bacterium]